eukprot:3175577-Ditylum_brightwellii.AAC.1
MTLTKPLSHPSASSKETLDHSKFFPDIDLDGDNSVRKLGMLEDKNTTLGSFRGIYYCNKEMEIH